MRRRRRLVWVVAAWTLVAITLASVGCGKKADPQPPVVRRADATRDLTAYQDADEVVLDWGYPSITTAGGPLPDLELIEVWRAPIPLGQEPSETTANDRVMRVRLFEAQGERIASLDQADRDRATRGDRLVYRDDLEAWRKIHGAEQKVVLWYAVRSICCGGRGSDFSNIARLVPQLPPSPPEDLEAVAGPSGIRLSWRGSADATTLVERSPDGTSWSKVGAEPVAGSEYLDGTAVQGTTWRYRVRSVRKREGEGRVVGDPGPVVTVDYPDTYPPSAPTDLVCLPEEQRVEVRWRGVAGAASYRVERRRGDRLDLLAEAHSETSFDDEDPPVGDLTYLVSSVDAAGNVSDPVTCTATLGTAP